jgi:hypothetical protein
MSVAVFVAAMLGPRLAAGFAPKRVAQAGLLILAAASVLLLSTIDPELPQPGFGISLALFGVGAGLLLSQLGNVIMSSVDPSKTNEAGGLQGTAQNLGASLGTALIGAVLITKLTTSFVENVERNPDLPDPVKERVGEIAREGIPVASVEEVERAARERGFPPRQAEEIADDYGDAEIVGLKRAIGAVAVFALLALWFTRGLPGASAAAPAPRPAQRQPAPEPDPARSARSPT